MVVAFTISTANYLPYAQSLSQSFLRHNPGKEFIIVLADELPAQAHFFDQSIIAIAEMNIPGFDDMNSRYSIFELSCAIKPFAAYYLLNTVENCDAVFYFDCDMLVYAPLHKAEALLRDHAMLITPHIDFSADYPHKEEVELMVLKAGIFNAGFFGINKSAEGMQILSWWKERMRKQCYVDQQNGLFVDQLWLNLVPVYFPTAYILRDPGYNAAYWNLGERKIKNINGSYFVNSTSLLVLYHFSGYNIHEPGILTRHLEVFNFKNKPEMQSLFDEYRDRAFSHNIDDIFSVEPKLGKPAEIIPDTEPEATPPVPPKREKFFKRKYKKWFDMS